MPDDREISVGIYRIRTTVSPTPPRSGTTHLVVRVNRPVYVDGHLQSQPSRHLKMEVLPLSPAAAPNAARARPLLERAPGRYEGDVVLSTPGVWRLRITLAGPDGSGKLTVPVTIPSAAR